MFLVGCAGWSIPRPMSSEFPDGASHLERYSQVFSCAEINSSFYRSHRATTWRRWADAVPPDFRFSVKAPRAITHDSALQCPIELVATFLQEASLLEEKLGAILLQTPPKLEFKKQVVEDFFALLRTLYKGPVALEPRHASWFTESANDLMDTFQIARVAADPAPVKPGAAPGGSSSLAYYRWHGAPRKYYSSYSQERLTQLANALQSVKEPSAWCIFDNTASGAAAENALHLKRILSEG